MIKTSFSLVIPLLLVSVLAVAGEKREPPGLCQANENTVWSCQAARKTFSLCASGDLGANSGYLQYRAGTSNDISFRFPSKLVHPRGRFEYRLLPHGAGLSFKNGAYSYAIAEDLNALAVIWVHGPNGLDSNIQCESASQTLTLTTTMQLLRAAGLSDEQ